MQFQTLSIFCLLAVQLTAGSSLRGGASRQLQQSSSVLCRMVAMETMEEDNEMVSVETIPGCIPIVDGVESEDIVPLSALPADITQAHEAQLDDGTLFVQITNAALVGDNDIAYSSSSDFIVVQNRRHLEIEHERRLTKAVNGTMTVAVVRISTLDATPIVSTQDLQGLLDTNAINFRTQYDKCSNGKLKFVRSSAGDKGVINVQVQQPVADFGTKGGGQLVTAAQKALKTQLNIAAVSGIADRVIMCLPPGTGNWVASAGMFHWRAQFNNEWCVSLTATMHELGHTIGLVHSNENFVAYGDKTGYMAKGLRTAHSPQRCFNGQNNNHLGWYNDRKLTMTNSTGTGARKARKVRLAAFVDHSLTTWTDSQQEPVLVNVADEIFVQYNRASKYNIGTGEYPDTVTVTTKPQQGGSQLVAALSPGETYQVADFYGQGKTLVIEVCESVMGSSQRPDIAVISVGKNRSTCNDPDPVQSAEKEEEEEEEEETPRQSLSSWILNWILRYRRRPAPSTPATGKVPSTSTSTASTTP